MLLAALPLSAQIHGTVVNQKGNPVPYVNIWVENENIGTTSDEKGFFKIEALAGKTIILSSVGYEIKKTALKDNEKITLQEAVYKLEEVVLIKRKEEKELEIGGAEKIHHRQLSGDKPWMYGKLFPNDPAYKATPFLKKIVFYSDSEKKGALLKIRVFEYNGSLPGADMLSEDLIVPVKRGMRKNTIDISKYDLQLPEKGVVVALEWMIIEENRADFKYKDNGKMVTMESYAPSLVINYTEEEVSFSYSKGKWSRSKIIRTDKNDKPWYNKVMVPAINLILTN